MNDKPTSVLAAGSLIGAYAVASGSGSRSLGGLALAAGGLYCARTWMHRHGPRTALALTGVGFCAFVSSHLLAHAIGAWPAVLTVAAATGAIVYIRSDAVQLGSTGAATSSSLR